MARRQKYILIFAGLLIATAISLIIGLSAGAGGFNVPDLDTGIGRGIAAIRISRVAAGFLVGAALACSGVIMQALLRNPLADPYVLGVSSGAALGAALSIVAGLSGFSAVAIPSSAFIFAVLTMALVYFIGSRGGRPTVYGLLLSGVIISSLCSSLLMLLISMAPGEGLRTITWWMLGNLDAASPHILKICAVLIFCGIIGAWSIARQLNALTLGSDMAHHLGVRSALFIGAGLALATLMTALAVSLAGLIGFVGLIIPHAVRAAIGADHRACVPASAICGGIFLVLCDAISRLFFGAVSIPAGVITALIGGPFFLILLHRRRKHGWVE